MIGLIPFIQNDYLLFGLYLLITVVSLIVHRERNDLVVYAFGVIALTVSETLFVSTGVEEFQRKSLLGMMPVWLPFLWGYGFIAIKRSIRALES